MLVSSTDMNIPTITTSSGSPHLVVTSAGGGGVGDAALVGRARVATAVRDAEPGAVDPPDPPGYTPDSGRS
jgi:hypothetical protein